MKDRFEIAADLRGIANLLRIKGENPFKAQAYERGAAALENFEGDLDTLVKQNRLTELAGIGAALAAIIKEIHDTGECWLLQQLSQELPRGAAELSEIPGLNLKKIIALDESLQIESIADLKSACQEGLVSKVKGFGLKSQAKLLADIEKLETPKDGFLLLPAALDEADRLIKHLRGCEELIKAHVAGGLRRRKEMIRKISIIAASEQPKAVLNQFLRYPFVVRTDELGDVHCEARLVNGIRAEVVIVPPDDFITALHTRTGSGQHIKKLKKLARGQGIDFHNGSAANGTTEPYIKEESEIYRWLGLPYIVPELREDEGEIEAARSGTLPQPIALEDIRGMTHCHTVYSDGRDTIEEMALAAQAMGMTYLTITDHSQTASYARGIGVDRLRAQWDEIARVQDRVGIKILKGTESDILADGSLDYPDHVLGASISSSRASMRATK